MHTIYPGPPVTTQDATQTVTITGRENIDGHDAWIVTSRSTTNARY